MRLYVPALVSGCLAAAPACAAAQVVAGRPTAVVVSGPDVGRRAPDFTLAWASREGVGPAELPYQLARDLGQVVVLAFYPRDFTPSATAQLRLFTGEYDNLFGQGVVVFGISPDSPATHSRFAASLDLPFRLLSDPGQRVARKYGAHGSSGYPRRSIYVIGRDGKVRYRDLHFDPLDPKDFTSLRAAVQAARTG